MRNRILTALYAALIFPSMNCLAQTGIAYGSNNGKYQEVKGTKIYYEEYGKGIPLLLIHGGLSSMTDLAAVIPELSKNFRVIAVDCPGQGRSEQADSVSFQLMADYFSQFMDNMKLDSVYILGYGDGGSVGLLMAADRPDKVKKIAAFGAASHLEGYSPEATAALTHITPAVVEKDYSWWLENHLKKTPQKSQWKKFITDFGKMAATPVIIPNAKLKEISSKVLIVQGDNDIIKLDHGVKLHQSIKGSQFCVVPATSHFILMERPELFTLIIQEFFIKVPKVAEWG